jgi:hypothetical protein
MKNAGIRVGLTISIEQGSEPQAWSNGAFQNIVFLYQLLCQSSADVVLVNHAHQPAAQYVVSSTLSIPLVPLREAVHVLDVMVMVGIELPHEVCTDFRAKGGKVVSFHLGNQYFMVLENIIFDLKRGAGAVSGLPLDAVWISAHHEKCNRSLFEVTTQAPVSVMPYLWSPMFIDEVVRSRQLNYGYQPNKPQKKIAIFEPNLNVVKNSIIPMLIAEQAWRTCPELIAGIHVTNTERFHQQPAFVSFAQSLTMTQQGVASYDARYDTASFMTLHADVVVSHQFENEFNYLYLDILYGGYPLIHNASAWRECGYYYEGFDATAGAAALGQALLNHDAQLDDYQQRNQCLFDRLSIHHADNIAGYEHGLDVLFAKPD